ncbi:hypothetical protein L1F30_04260 [Simiduia sp. 21SJ11W-1]|uniref:alpha/beta hydrolase-fold protein n=1 Tax=Simiduia sp. 21SJ11W-1 TaxID=2909669 RepID=UPI00209CAA95|nr:alpha/beta hydrolase-fold protein [Simiduia sp. 21SJ11W-1]UTA48762.1 hypothetical protein L1F30_04260 [Simiduia sp. 21SJ11W-1]
MSIRVYFVLVVALVSAGGYLTAFADEARIIIEPSATVEKPGRLYLVLVPANQMDNSEKAVQSSEPRFYSAWPTQDVELMFAVDLPKLEGSKVISGSQFKGFPLAHFSDVSPGLYAVQAIYDTNFIDSGINSEGNYYSESKIISVEDGQSLSLTFNLNKTIPLETMPDDERFLKYIKFKSPALSAFWGRDIFLRAAILLPHSYYDEPSKRFPLFFDIGGYGARYTRAQRWHNDEAFQSYWSRDDTPQMVIVFLDGEAPYGDPYQINSANNGPYGDATWNELLPYITSKLNVVESAQGRFVSGCSTGGWVSLAVQLFYPDTFNGAWSYSADGVDFRHFQLVNVYEDDNAFVNEYGQVRPSYRAKDGEVIFSIQHEIEMENALGRGNSFATSGGQWGGWNAVYSPRDSNGKPATIWDPQTGKIDKAIAVQWSKYDLRLYTEQNWAELGPKLAGKLHIWMGDMDNFYLNNAMYVYEKMLSDRGNPKSDAKFTWLRGVGHCDFDSLEMRRATIKQMHQRFVETMQ